MINVINFGCRLNAYEGEVIRAAAVHAGVRNTLVINSCAVTEEAERQVRQAIRKARREHPAARIIVTGCAAQIHPDEYAAMPEVDHVLGNGEKTESAAYARLLEAGSEKAIVNDIMS
ncbi:MAG: tRNA (N(6)-L-threonylcarbamoyladenosine(37)-C(2))-methylthiotransferase MtaB, partial [Alphaproteobacteria bacterium]|nr:tRNA (N(6)-L-threonylcarbamoyladenosine(37)-C(2))-methylthiotransferase MtaB [Alphaproteobacteria bacterium]